MSNAAPPLNRTTLLVALLSVLACTPPAVRQTVTSPSPAHKVATPSPGRPVLGSNIITNPFVGNGCGLGIVSSFYDQSGIAEYCDATGPSRTLDSLCGGTPCAFSGGGQGTTSF